MYDDDEEEDEETDFATDAETARRVDAETSRGKEERAFYDGLAKTEDERHNAMRRDFQKRSIAAGELRQKLRHKEGEARAISMKISIEEDLINYEQKKMYRSGGNNPEVGAHDVPQVPIPILSRDINPTDSAAEFSIERALMHVKQLQEEKHALEEDLRMKLEHLHEEERALSQLQHVIMRM